MYGTKFRYFLMAKYSKIVRYLITVIIALLNLGFAAIGLFGDQALLGIELSTHLAVTLFIFAALILAIQVYTNASIRRNEARRNADIEKIAYFQYELALKEKEVHSLNNVLNTINELSDGSYRHLIKLVAETYNNGEEVNTIIGEPRYQLKHLVDAMKDNLLNYFDKEKNAGDVHTILAYRIPKISDKWAYVYGNGMHELSLTEIMSSNSTFAFITNPDNVVPFLFFNSKKNAERRGMYLNEPKDTYNQSGSIFCKYMQVTLENGDVTLIEAVLSISTYGFPLMGRELTEKEEKVLGEVINMNVFHRYEARMRTELLLLYIEETSKIDKTRNRSLGSGITDSVQERIFENLPSRIAERVVREIRNELQQIHDIGARNKIGLEMQQFCQTCNGNAEPSSRSLYNKLFQTQMRELFHSLMTPVTTVDTSIRLIKISKDDVDFNLTLSENLSSINNGIILIKALLYAYRGLALTDFSMESSGIEINEFLNETIKSLNKQHGKSTTSKIDKLEGSFDGFSVELVVALLLPLLQNAIEASPNDGLVSIHEVRSESKIKIEIVNTSVNFVKNEDLQQDGFSTKKDAESLRNGIGLPAVRHIANELQIDFNLKSTGHTVMAALSFPRRARGEE